MPIVDHHAALHKDTQAVIDVAFTPVDRCRVSSLTIAMPDAINFNGFLGTLLAKSYQDGESIEADMRELSITENPSPVIACSFGSERLDRTVIGTSLASIASQLARIGYGEDSSDDSKASKAAIATLENLELLMRAIIISTQEETDATSVKP